MKKRLFIDKPDTNMRGQYIFFDDNATLPNDTFSSC